MTCLIRAVAVFFIASAASLTADPIQIVPKATTFLTVPTTGTIRPSVGYTAGDSSWVTTTVPLSFESATLLSSEGNENPYLQVLDSYGNDWTFDFATSTTIADNTFQVQTYDALGPTPPASNNDAFVAAQNVNPFAAGCVTNNNCVGAEFQVAYNPTGDDPPANANLHWIQVIDNNFPVFGGFQVDAGAGIPYYDDGGTANSTGFLDLAGLGMPNQSTFFDATLFLVSGPAPNNPGLVTIYGAVQWGFDTSPTPEPSTFLLLAGGLGLMGTIVRRRLS